MGETNDKIILRKISKDIYDEAGSMDLDNCYDQTVAELGLQQTKRDQIIAFYLTILGFVIPNVIQLNIDNIAKCIAFIAMYFIGLMFCHVILRYRIYKEVYWIACRVITQMCNIKAGARSRDVIYSLFYNALKKNMGTIVIKDKNGKNSLLKSFKRQLNSSETLLFETLVFFTTFVGAIGAWYIKDLSYIAFGSMIIVMVFMLVRLNYKYSSRLMELYECVSSEKISESEKISDLERTFAKAWMLHCYVDDIIEE